MTNHVLLYNMCPFTTRNREIKRLEKLDQAIREASREASRDESSDQAHILMIKILITVTGGSAEHTVVTTPCRSDQHF